MKRLFSAIALLAAAACTGPEPPVIPPQEVIGPPAAAGDHCPREAVNRFAQRWFHVADLDQGKMCEAFIEQDECVIALFRDCTDTLSNIPRSWQGSIDKTRKITLERTTESNSGVMARAPTGCTGELMTQATEPIGTWAKLNCTIPVGTHGGFYFERSEMMVEPFARIDMGLRIDVLRDPPSSDQIPDFAVLERKGEIWALVATGNNLGGLYTGLINSAGLTRSTITSFRSPRKLIVDEAETFALITESDKLLRIDLASTSTIVVSLGRPIVDVELTAQGILVGVAIGTEDAPETELRFLNPTTLEQLAVTPRSFLGDVEDIVPFNEIGTSAIALLMFDNDIKVNLIDATFGDAFTADMLPEPPRRAVMLPGRQRVGFSGSDSDSASFFTVRVTDGRVSPRIKVPGQKIESLFFSSRLQRLLIGTDERKLIPFDVQADRPLIQQILETPEVTDLVREDRSGRMFALSALEGVIDPLLQ